MKKKLLSLFLLCTGAVAMAQSVSPEFRPLMAAAPFEQCVWKATRLTIAWLRAYPPSTDPSVIEGAAWNMVLDRCERVLTHNEVRDILLSHFSGDEKRTIDFRDGMLSFARAYVLHAVVESRKGVTTQ